MFGKILKLPFVASSYSHTPEGQKEKFSFELLLLSVEYLIHFIISISNEKGGPHQPSKSCDIFVDQSRERTAAETDTCYRETSRNRHLLSRDVGYSTLSLDLLMLSHCSSDKQFLCSWYLELFVGQSCIFHCNQCSV